MRVLLNIALILSLLTEVMAAASLIGGPEGISAAGKGGMWSMHYGFAALAIASATIWIWPHRNNLAAVTAVLGILLTFHSGLFVSLALAGDQMAGMIVHATLALLFIFLFAMRSKWCANENNSEEAP